MLATALLPGFAAAGPDGASVAAGQISISNPNPQTTLIEQGSASAIINWDAFSIGLGETVVFDQPSASAAVLNRVIGGSPSEILGQMSANGRVFLINPQGVLFGQGAVINVGALVASTLDIQNQDFLDGSYVFEQSTQSTAAISHAGLIEAADGGFVVLSAAQVSNSGLIRARLGDVLLASGSHLTLSLDDAGLVNYVIDGAIQSDSAAVNNLGEIIADGGQVVLSAQVARELTGVAVNHSGRISARSIDEQEGSIVLSADGGDLAASGELDVSAAAQGPAGSIRASSSHDLTLGDTAARQIILNAGGAVNTGSLSVSNLTGEAAIHIQSGGKITVEGAVSATSRIDEFNVGADERFVLGAALVEMIAASGGIEIQGALTLDGSINSASLNTQTLYGSFLNLYADNDDIVLHGPLSLSGSIGTVGAEVNPFSVYGTQASITSNFGAVTLEGSAAASGSVASVQGFELEAVSGAFFSVISNGHLDLQNTLNVSGTVSNVVAGDSFSARGAEVFLFSEFGATTLQGLATVSATLGSVQGNNFLTADAASFSLRSVYGTATLNGGLSVSGTVNSVSGGSGISASGAQVSLLSELDLEVNGAIEIAGSVVSLTSADESGTADFSGAIGADLSLLSFSGNSFINGATRVSGSITSLVADGSTFALGAFVNVSSFAGFGEGMRVNFEGPLNVDGSLGQIQAGAFSQLTGAGLYVDSLGAQIQLDGNLSVNGVIDSASLGHTSDATGAYANLASFSGATRVHGNTEVNGRIRDIRAPFALTATGSAVTFSGAFGSEAGAPSLSVNTLLQTGTLDHFQLLDEAPEEGLSSFLNGGARLDAGSGSIAFGDISADNLFIYFDADSTLTDSTTLHARDYLEIFTPSFGPVLRGGALTLNAQSIFLSAYVSAEQLSINGDEDITVYLGQLEAEALRLRTGGALTLIGGDTLNPEFPTFLAARNLQVTAGSIYGDAGSQIYADGLSLTARDTILLEGGVFVGDQPSGVAGDTALIERLRQTAPELAPAAIAGPNAYFSAETVALNSLDLQGDYLHVQSNFFFLGTARLEQPGTFVHFEPLTNLPFFAERVDVVATGLAEVQNRIRTDNGRITPNIGRFDDARGSNGPLGERVELNQASVRSPGQLDFTVQSERPSFGELILQSGLADSTLAIGGSAFTGAIQISDELAVEVQPSRTNFVFLTDSGILGVDRISTQGRIVVLGGKLFTLDKEFYDLVTEQITAYFASEENSAGEPVETSAREDEDQDGKDDSNCE